MTHCHIDHCLGNKYLNEKYGAELLIPFDERDLYKNVENIATLVGFANYSHLDENEYKAMIRTVMETEVEVYPDPKKYLKKVLN